MPIHTELQRKLSIQKNKRHSFWNITSMKAKKQKTWDILVIVAAWAIAVSLVYIVYVKYKILYH
jgi:hypothetical protein